MGWLSIIYSHHRQFYVCISIYYMCVYVYVYVCVYIYIYMYIIQDVQNYTFWWQLDEQRNESILDTVAKRFTEDKTKALCIPCKKISILSNMGVMAIKISHKRSVKHAKNFNSFNFHHQLASSSQSHFRLRTVHFKNKQK